MDRPLIEPGVAQVNDELEVGFDVDFEYRWSVAERFGRAFLLVVMLAGIAGVLGSGPLDHASIGTVASGGHVDDQPVARYGTATQITVHLPPGATSFRIGSAFIEPLGLATILPQPLRAVPEGGGIRLFFPGAPTGQASLVRFKGKPSVAGVVPVSVEIGAGIVRRWREIVLP